jgi:transcriptional regulator with XRE-family HTH domain
MNDVHSKRNIVGSVLADALRDARLSQAEVARRIGRPQKWVSDVEHGHAYCWFDEFMSLAIAVGADPATLCARYLEVQSVHEGLARAEWKLPHEE